MRFLGKYYIYVVEVQCTEYSRQAGQNCTVLEILGLFVYVLLKKVIFPILPFFTFIFVVYILRGKATYLSYYLILMCTPANAY